MKKVLTQRAAEASGKLGLSAHAPDTLQGPSTCHKEAVDVAVFVAVVVIVLVVPVAFW